MMSTRALQAAAVVVAISALSACVDEQGVFENREFFENPPSAAASFLGYGDRDSKLTICGNCHVESQSQWEGTAHAGAWASLQESGVDEEFCEACHSVNALGNPAEGAAGYVSTGDARYEDVQCEACHGPGLAHVLNPKDETIPLAPMTVGVANSAGCGECHQGTHQPFVEEWAASRHGRINVYPAGQEGTCDQCHTGEAALRAWGIDSPYLEKDSLSLPGEHMPITCGVCHDPHGGPNEAQLRFPLDAPDVDANLCMKCHQGRGNPDPKNERGPHSPEGPTLLGYAGWWPPSMEWGQDIVGTHGDSEANPKLCAQCHVFPFQVTDEATGDLVFQATGHSFAPIPCLDAQGRPDPQATCDDQERTFQSCTGSGCHTDQTEARTARSEAVTRMETLVTELRALLDQVPSTEFNTRDNRYTVAEGARFNAVLGVFRGAAVHNPVLVEALLLGSIDAVEQTYGVAAASTVSRTPAFELH
jgi:predicted CXXCH cytochrome family protein